MNLKFILLFNLIVLLQLVKSVTVMTKKDILNLDLKQHIIGSTCPETSGGTFLGFTCSFTFYCQGDDYCQPDTDIKSPFFEFTEKDGSIKKYIKTICPKEDHNCNTEKCTADSDCMSNSCFNNTCIQGQSLFTECSDNSDDSNKNNKLQVMKCGKLNGESCQKDNECAGKCLSGTECNSHVYLTSSNSFPIIYLIYGGVGLLIVAIFICCCTRCCIGRNKKIRK